MIGLAKSHSRLAAILIALLAVLLSDSPTSSTGKRDTSLFETFDGPPGRFSKRLLDHPAITLATGEGVAASTAIRVDYQGYTRGSRRVIVSDELPGQSLESSLSYDVKLCDDFRFVKGGKLHGLGPDDPATGGMPVSEDQWSARVVFLQQGRIGAYLYHQQLHGQYGETVTAKNFKFVPGRYYRVSMRVRLNEPPDAANGFVQVFVDGIRVVERKAVRFRSVGEPKSSITQVLFNTFHGGHTIDYAPRNDDGTFASECAYFDNFSVSG